MNSCNSVVRLDIIQSNYMKWCWVSVSSRWSFCTLATGSIELFANLIFLGFWSLSAPSNQSYGDVITLFWHENSEDVERYSAGGEVWAVLSDVTQCVFTAADRWRHWMVTLQYRVGWAPTNKQGGDRSNGRPFIPLWLNKTDQSNYY